MEQTFGDNKEAFHNAKPAEGPSRNLLAGVRLVRDHFSDHGYRCPTGPTYRARKTVGLLPHRHRRHKRGSVVVCRCSGGAQRLQRSPRKSVHDGRLPLRNEDKGGLLRSDLQKSKVSSVQETTLIEKRCDFRL